MIPSSDGNFPPLSMKAAQLARQLSPVSIIIIQAATRYIPPTKKEVFSKILQDEEEEK